MQDRVVFSIMAAIAVALISLAAVWPQGYGARSPGPFGHTPLEQTPQMREAMAREAEAEARVLKAKATAAAAHLRQRQ